MCSTMHIVAIVQARMGSTRLPGKVLRDLAGEPMLIRVVNRLRRSQLLSNIVVATTTADRDTIIADLCAGHSVDCFRGSEEDVLDRYYQTARIHNAENVVRITSDCPLIDPQLVDEMVAGFLKSEPVPDYMSNTVGTRTYPRGLDVEIMTCSALERAWKEAVEPSEREHVTPYIYRHTHLFDVRSYSNQRDYSEWRWTVDEPDDLTLIKKIYAHFTHDDFSWTEVIQLLEEHPEWIEINRHVKQKVV